MKKKMLLGLFVVIPFLTACGSNEGSSASGNTMKCEYSSSNEISGYIFKFDGDKLSGIELYEGIDLDKLTDDDPCSDKASCVKLAESTKEECSKDSDFENCRVETTDSTVKVVGEYGSSYFENTKYYKKGMSKSEVRKQAEKDELTCE